MNCAVSAVARNFGGVSQRRLRVDPATPNLRDRELTNALGVLALSVPGTSADRHAIAHTC
jgi:hypothetical protein